MRGLLLGSLLTAGMLVFPSAQQTVTQWPADPLYETAILQQQELDTFFGLANVNGAETFMRSGINSITETPEHLLQITGWAFQCRAFERDESYLGHDGWHLPRNDWVYVIVDGFLTFKRLDPMRDDETTHRREDVNNAYNGWCAFGNAGMSVTIGPVTDWPTGFHVITWYQLDPTNNYRAWSGNAGLWTK